MTETDMIPEDLLVTVEDPMPPITKPQAAAMSDHELTATINILVDEAKRRRGPLATFELLIAAFGT